jgi:hypothetical protein
MHNYHSQDFFGVKMKPDAPDVVLIVDGGGGGGQQKSTWGLIGASGNVPRYFQDILGHG